MLSITDLNGCPIEVTDLDEAIGQASRFLKYHHEDKYFADFDKKQKAYWQDIHKKLLRLRTKQN